MAPPLLNNTTFHCNDGTPLNISLPPLIDPRLSCSEHIFSVELTGSGGIPPYSWLIIGGGVISFSGLLNEHALVQVNAMPPGPTVHCSGGEFDGQFIDHRTAYVRLGSGVFNTDSPDNTNCLSLDGNSQGGLAYNCNDQLFSLAGAGSYKDGEIIVLQSDIPIVCQQLELTGDPLNSDFDCGKPPCGDDALEFCNFSFGPGGSGHGHPANYMLNNPGVGLFLDVRTDAMKNEGCFPCKLLENLDLTITLIDAEENIAAFIIHVDP